MLDPSSPELREVVERAIRVKIDVVVADLRETGGVDGHPGREALNYGHTMAHAIERGTSYSVRHGEAVALGMVYVAELARLTGHLDEPTAKRHETVLESVGLPTRFGELPFDDLLGRDARGQEDTWLVAAVRRAGRPGRAGRPLRTRRGRPAGGVRPPERGTR